MSVFRKDTLIYLDVKGYHVCNLLLNTSEKIHMYTQWERGMNGKQGTAKY